jgi:hypothetical protein
MRASVIKTHVPYFFRFVLVSLFAMVSYKSLIKARSLPFYPPRKFKNYLSLGIRTLVILLLLGVLSTYIPQGYFFNGKPIRLFFPLKNGIYYVGHGGNSPTINYHNNSPAQQYALDIVKLNTLGTRANGLYPRSLANYAIFGETLYSPSNGTIRNTVNDLPDLILPEMDRQNPCVAEISVAKNIILYDLIKCFL